MYKRLFEYKKEIKLDKISRKEVERIARDGYIKDGIKYIIKDTGYSDDYYKKGGIGSRNTRFVILIPEK